VYTCTDRERHAQRERDMHRERERHVAQEGGLCTQEMTDAAIDRERER
jgi:hypothetical protein